MRWVEAGKAASMAAMMLGTVPVVGGYSNIAPGNDFSTVGIVIQVEGSAFAVEGDKSAADAVKVGQGLKVRDRMVVEPRSLVRVADTQGGQVTIAGPASVEISRKGRSGLVVRLLKGAARFKAADAQAIYFENALVAGSVAGEGAVWASSELVQVLGMAGDVKAWHPHLAQAALLVAPGFFTESSIHFRHLQPRRAARADAGRFERFLSRFQESFDSPAPPVRRGLASSELEEARGSRERDTLVEPPNPEIERRLKARIAGQEIDEPLEEPPLAIIAGPRFNSFSRSLGRGERAPAAEAIERAEREVEVVRQAREAEADAEERELLKKLREKAKR